MTVRPARSGNGRWEPVVPPAERSSALRWTCLALVALGSALSLSGPCWYWNDQDRDFYKTYLLLKGRVSVLLEGHEAQILGHTLSGLFYAILAPAMALSGNPEWLYTYQDGLVLLGMIPLWFLARFFAGVRAAWVAVALYAISSGRISNSHQGLHPSTSLPFSFLWHLSFVHFVEKPSVWKGLLAAGLIVLLLSLHLSYGTLLVAAPLAILAYRRPSGWMRRLIRPLRIALPLILVASLILLVATGKGIWVGKMVFCAANALAAMGEHVGFHWKGAWSHGVDLPDVYGVYSSIWLGFLPLALLAIGARAVAAAPTEHEGFPLELRPTRLKLLRIWLVVVAVVHLTVAMTSLREWRWNESHLRYRHVMTMAPGLVLLASIGVLRLAGLASGWLRKRVSEPAAAGGLLLLLAAGHSAALLYSYRAADWRIFGPAVYRSLRETLGACQDRWRFSKEWLESAAFIEYEVPFGRYETHLMPWYQKRWEYFLHWFTSQHGAAGLHGPADQQGPAGRHGAAGAAGENPDTTRAALSGRSAPEEVLYLAHPGGRLEQQILSAKVALEALDTPEGRWYLCRRSARGLLPAQPLCLTYAVSVLDRQWPGSVLNPGGGGSLVLVASNSAPPAELESEMLFEVVIEREEANLVVGCRVYGRGVHRLKDDLMVGPHVIVESAGGDVDRIDIPYDRFLDTRDLRFLTSYEVLEGWGSRDLAQVSFGIDSYLDPSHYAVPKTARWPVFGAARE